MDTVDLQEHSEGSFSTYVTKIMLIGNPNVGKSVIFGRLTNQYVTVSNYPGTTVTVTRGWMTTGTGPLLVIDTPGINNLLPNSEDEIVTRDILLGMAREDRVVHVIDTKNLQRGLFLTIQLGELGCLGNVVLNMWDESQLAGYEVDCQKLEEIFGTPFIPTIAVHNRGISRLKKLEFKPFCHSLKYPEEIEVALQEVSQYLPRLNVEARGLGLMALSGDPTFMLFLQEKVPPAMLEKIVDIQKKTEHQINMDVRLLLDNIRMAEATRIADQAMHKSSTHSERRLGKGLDKMTTHSIWGFSILLLVLFLTYQFVGVFGAGFLVNIMEKKIFNCILNPLLIRGFDAILPFPHDPIVEDGSLTPKYNLTQTLTWWQKPLRLTRDFFVGEYGVFTMAITYGIAIIFPVVVTFFLVFGLLEDLGYLSRLSILLNRVFKIMGLNGKAVLPMVLGLGCDTMATVTARILDTRKERIIVTFLLALAVPCSAQLAVVVFLLERSKLGLVGILIWLSAVGIVFLSAGALASYVIRGDKNPLILEIPPLRLPLLRNIVLKTLARVEWYIKEIIPIFVIGTAVLFILYETHLLELLERLLKPLVVNWLGLPQQASQAILMGFFRRDYGAAGFIKMFEEGMLTKAQILVGITTITLFVPCIANMLVIIKERGSRMGIYIFSIVMVIAFSTGGILCRVLRLMPGLLS